MDKIRTIKKLRGSENYKTWSEDIMLLLMEKNSWKCPRMDNKLGKENDETETAFAARLLEIRKVDPKLEDSDIRAMGILLNSVHPNYREIVISCSTSNEIWTVLKWGCIRC
jgi:hypothetical protein